MPLAMKTKSQGEAESWPPIIEQLVAALLEAIEAAEQHLLALGFDTCRLRGAKGCQRIEALRDAVDALYTSDEAKRRFEIVARQIFIRFRALLVEPSALAYAERHDNIEAICRKLQEKLDTADVTEVLKELHRVVNEAIRTAAPGNDHAAQYCGTAAFRAASVSERVTLISPRGTLPGSWGYLALDFQRAMEDKKSTLLSVSPLDESLLSHLQQGGTK